MPALDPALTWSLTDRPDALDVTTSWWPRAPDLAEATGRGVRVCVLDSGIEPDHPEVGPIQGSYAVLAEDDGVVVRETEAGDVCGHGTACAGIIRKIAPECELYSVRVLGPGFAGRGNVFVAGLRWAVEQGFDVINLSLSTTRRQLAEDLREVSDDAYFRRTVIVASAHNLPVESYPWRFSSVISVGSHAEDDPDLIIYNPRPPVEFFAHGSNVEVAWPGGRRRRCTGNSFATPHVTGLCALVLSGCPRLTPFQVKNALYMNARNVRREP
ncbi:S8 family peptidase [Nonomuraea sp. CA-141351]|uniref:S8 family peptidase n=1 Tax=Nonomuraea sp. CA-141351 TaxID=3239996 RepID=UPI003D93F811